MKLKVIYGNDETEEWEDVAVIEVDPYQPVKTPPKKRSDLYDWRLVSFPNGEEIEVYFIYEDGSPNMTLNVRQGSESICQVLGASLSSVCFKTLQGKMINIQTVPLWDDS